MNQELLNNKNYLICGDSTKNESYEKVLPNLKANLLLADPPYCLLERRNKKTGQLRDPKKAKINHEAVKRYANVKEYKLFTKAWMTPALSSLEDDAIACIWTNFLGKKPITDVAEELGYTYFHGEFLWAKLTKEGSGNELLARLYEVALIFSKKPIKEIQNSSSSYSPMSVITHYDEEKEAGDWGLHPNHKPFSCMEPLIRTYSKPGDRILDPFNGSGSTPAAAIKLDRYISGIELREHYAKITTDRALFETKIK